MVSYTKDQEKVARVLLKAPKSLEELRKETELDALSLNEALKAMQKLKVIELEKGRYQLVKQVTEAFDETRPFKVAFIIEGTSPKKEIVVKQINFLAEKLKLNLKLENINVAEPIEDKGVCSMYIEFTARFKNLHEVINAIVNYGPSSVEVLEPKSLELNTYDIQRVVSDITSAVHYYSSVILRATLQLQEARNALAKTMQNKEKKSEKKDSSEAQK